MFERLTARSLKNNMAYLVKVKPDEQDVESPYPNTLKAILESFNRLATYEDSGLSPEEVQELAKTKAEGRLTELPCKAGDTVYAVQDTEIIQCRVTEITINEKGISYIRLFTIDDRLAYFQYEHFQKTVFLTREEAEKALGGGQSENRWCK